MRTTTTPPSRTVGRPKKTSAEKWQHWSRDHIGRTYSDDFDAGVRTWMEAGRHVGELRVILKFPIGSTAHGRALADKLYEMIEHEKGAITTSTMPSALQRELLGKRVEEEPVTRTRRA